MTKYVFSRSKKSDRTNAIFMGSDLKEKVTDIKNQDGKNIWLYGGAKIITTFLNLNLVDEIRLAVHPVILGSGKPLFEDIKYKRKLKLLDIASYDSGVFVIKYKVDTDAN